jgi:hypothetical protein
MKNQNEYAVGIILGVVLLWLFYSSLPQEYKPACENCQVCPTCHENPYSHDCVGYCDSGSSEGRQCVHLPEGGCGCQEQA